jgi:hypothetical protein
MIEEAVRLAQERLVSNARWVHMRAEDLPAGLGLFRAATFASSFHWMDRPRVASTVRAMLEPGGALIHVDNRQQEFDNRDLPHPPLPARALMQATENFLGGDRRAGRGIRNTSPSDEDDVFRAAGFRGPHRVRVPDGRILTRTIDDVIAATFSASYSAPHLFGDGLSDFEAELRRVLAEESPAGLFSVRLPDNELKIWEPRAG